MIRAREKFLGIRGVRRKQRTDRNSRHGTKKEGKKNCVIKQREIQRAGDGEKKKEENGRKMEACET